MNRVTRPSPNPETFEVLLDTSWRVATAELSQTEGLDRKAVSLAAFASLVLSVTATLGTGLLDRFPAPWSFGVYVVALAALTGAIALAVLVLLPEEQLNLGAAYLEGFPTSSEILKPPEQVRGETMLTLIQAAAREREVNNAKSKHVRRAFVLLLLGLGFVAGEAVILAAEQVFV